MDNRDIFHLIVKKIDSPSAFYNFALVSKKCYTSAQLSVLDKKEQFKSFDIGAKSESNDLIGGYFVLPNQTRYPENVIVITDDGHFEVWSEMDLIHFAHGFKGHLLYTYENVDLANVIFAKLKRELL